MEGLDGAEGRCRLVGRRMTKGSLNSCSATVQRADHTPQQSSQDSRTISKFNPCAGLRVCPVQGSYHDEGRLWHMTG